jgi:hypothetical protein
MLGHPEKVTDFGYRAIHEMTVQGKAIVNGFYSSAPKFSYFNGCSLGGRQGITEAQRYPADYDGIVAGAPAAKGRSPTIAASFCTRSGCAAARSCCSQRSLLKSYNSQGPFLPVAISFQSPARIARLSL